MTKVIKRNYKLLFTHCHEWIPDEAWKILMQEWHCDPASDHLPQKTACVYNATTGQVEADSPGFRRYRLERLVRFFIAEHCSGALPLSLGHELFLYAAYGVNYRLCLQGLDSDLLYAWQALWTGPDFELQMSSQLDQAARRLELADSLSQLNHRIDLAGATPANLFGYFGNATAPSPQTHSTIWNLVERIFLHLAARGERPLPANTQADFSARFRSAVVGSCWSSLAYAGYLLALPDVHASLGLTRVAIHPSSASFRQSLGPAGCTRLRQQLMALADYLTPVRYELLTFNLSQPQALHVRDWDAEANELGYRPTLEIELIQRLNHFAGLHCSHKKCPTGEYLLNEQPSVLEMRLYRQVKLLYGVDLLPEREAEVQGYAQAIDKVFMQYINPETGQLVYREYVKHRHALQQFVEQFTAEHGYEPFEEQLPECLRRDAAHFDALHQRILANPHPVQNVRPIKGQAEAIGLLLEREARAANEALPIWVEPDFTTDDDTPCDLEQVCGPPARGWSQVVDQVYHGATERDAFNHPPAARARNDGSQAQRP